MIDRSRTGLFFLMLILLAFAGSPGGILLGQELKLQMIGVNEAVVSGGRQKVNIGVIATSAGLVVVDTGESEEEGNEARKLIEAAFPGRKFIYVINTHSHWDHIMGNPAFPEAKIVAHLNCREAMEKKRGAPAEGNSPASEIPVDSYVSEGSPGLPPPPPPAGTIWIEESKYDSTVPDITFTDSMSLFCGDTTFRLFYFGEAHTISDIVILVPEKKLLLAGDLFFKDWLPVFSEWLTPDTARWAQVKKILDKRAGEFETVITGHGELMSREELDKQFRYRLELWNKVKQAVASGMDLGTVSRSLKIEKMFPDLAAWNIKNSRGQAVHDENIRVIFAKLSAAR